MKWKIKKNTNFICSSRVLKNNTQRWNIKLYTGINNTILICIRLFSFSCLTWLTNNTRTFFTNTVVTQFTTNLNVKYFFEHNDLQKYNSTAITRVIYLNVLNDDRFMCLPQHLYRTRNQFHNICSHNSNRRQFD